MRLDDILREATEARATDVYLVPGSVPCMSVEGNYIPVRCAGGRRVAAEQTAEFAQSAMTEKQWRDFESTLEMNMAYMSPNTERFRMNFFWQRGSIGMVARRVVADIPTLRALGLPPVLREVALADRGIVLVTGSTGSGKSTTLASMIDYRNHLLTGHIVTIEDPVEFVYRHRRSIVTQREVGIDTQGFHEALKNSLRQAPQVICIGELRDEDTVQFAMHASETGHLVFATLHSTNATLAIERILHFYPGEMKDQILIQLSLNLKAIICQRLVPRISGGRACAVEILINTPRVQDLIAKGDNGALKQAIALDNQTGLINFDRSLYNLVKQGKVSQDEALQAAESANDLGMKFKGIGITAGSSWEQTGDEWAAIRDDYEFPPVYLAKQKRRDSTGLVYTNEGVAPLPPPRPAQNMARRPEAGPPAPGQGPQPGPGRVPSSGPPPGGPPPGGPPRPAGPPGTQPPQPAPGAPPPQRPAPPPQQVPLAPQSVRVQGQQGPPGSAPLAPPRYPASQTGPGPRPPVNPGTSRPSPPLDSDFDH